MSILVFTFLLPFPIAVVAFWFPRSAGIALILSGLICVATLVCVDGIKDTVTASPGLKLYIPHLILASAYFMLGRVSKDAGSGGEKRPVGAA